MNPGRGMAQAAHAANQCVFEHRSSKEIKNWQDDANGFGTTICLSANKQEIHRIIKAAKRNNACVGLVFDPTYKYSVDSEVANVIPSSASTAEPIFQSNGLVVLFRNELTCGYVFVLDGDAEQKELVAALPLHP